jgi:DNA-binding NarL/FixJ family response regulator
MIRVLLVDDDPLVRAGLAMIIATTADLHVVGEAGDGEEAVDGVREHHPDVVLMDIRMPVLDGIRATAQVRALAEPPEVLVLTTIAADASVLSALRAGASGFLLKDTPPAMIVGAIRQVAGGVPSLSPSVARTVIDHVAREGGAGAEGAAARQAAARRTLDGLTDRERDVAVQVGRGLSNAEIGAALFLSEATVKTHVSRLLTKLGLNNRVQIAMLVHDAGMR